MCNCSIDTSGFSSIVKKKKALNIGLVPFFLRDTTSMDGIRTSTKRKRNSVDLYRAVANS